MKVIAAHMGIDQIDENQSTVIESVQIDFFSSPISIEDDQGIVKNYTFVSFEKRGKVSKALKDIIKHLGHDKIAFYWIWTFLCASICYIAIGSFVMFKVSNFIIKPITKLTDIIKNSIKNVKNNKRSKEVEKEAKMTMRFAEGFENTNQEMNELFSSFTQMAKKIMVCQ